MICSSFLCVFVFSSLFSSVSQIEFRGTNQARCTCYHGDVSEYASLHFKTQGVKPWKHANGTELNYEGFAAPLPSSGEMQQPQQQWFYRWWAKSWMFHSTFVHSCSRNRLICQKKKKDPKNSKRKCLTCFYGRWRGTQRCLLSSYRWNS